MSRKEAATILVKLIDESKSLTELRTDLGKIPPKDKPLAQELCYGVARWYYQLSFIVDQFLKKQPKAHDTDIYILMLIGVYQLLHTRIPDHAAISETVDAARKLNKEWATKLINAVLRNFLKTKSQVLEALSKNEEAFYSHPKWFISRITTSWPDFKEVILNANNQYPPLCLRVNQLKTSREHYLDVLNTDGILAEPILFTQNGIQLAKAIDLNELPNFNEGYVSVQDGAAQLAAELLNVNTGDNVLDACAAPGGKTCHILEQQPHLKNLLALDNDEKRLQKIKDNLNRLNLTAQISHHDVTDLSWWDGTLFDRILVDVPCSALGVIRRHPDIKLLREDTDILPLTLIQYHVLESVWSTLKKGGSLLYVTCSILPEENEQVIQKFIEHHPDCQEDIITADWGLARTRGRQILPGMHTGMDGFYFAKLIKKELR